MQKTKILTSLVEKKDKKVKSLSVLVHPDKVNNEKYLEDLLHICHEFNIDYIFVGCSLLLNNTLATTDVGRIRSGRIGGGHAFFQRRSGDRIQRFF